MTTVPVLVMLDFNAPFIVDSDASGSRLGAVLMQNQRPIAYFSQAFSERQKLKSVYERELMAIVFAVQKWRHYLIGRKFIVRTDQKSLRFLLEQREVNLDYQRWMNKLLGFDFEIQYKPGLENRAADALSRKVSTAELLAVSVPVAIQLEDICGEVEKDPELTKIIQELQVDPASHQGYTWVHHRLLRNGKLVVPKQSPLIGVILKEFYDNKMGGHGGVLKTQRRIAEVFYWVGMMTDIRRYVASCQVCQRHKYSTLAPSGLLQPLPIPERIWEDISLDFVEGLPKSEGFNTVLVVIDRLMKYAHFLGLKHPYNASDVALLFIQEIVRLHGFPRTIVSDRDKVFTSAFWKELFQLSGTSLNLSTAYHPQSNGQTEVTNRGMETYLRCYASDKPRTWSKFLSWAELSYNTLFHSAIQMSPFKAVYGRDPPTLLKYESGSTSNQMLELIRDHLHKAQQCMKLKADKHRREVEFEVWDLVYLKLRPYRQQTVARRANEKLAARFYGPFEIKARVGKVDYNLELPEDSKIHPMFHVSQLKKVIGDPTNVTPLPPQLTREGVLGVEPETVLNERVNATTGQEELLIKWKGVSELDCTWEWKSTMKKQDPGFDLEVKVGFEGEGNDTYEANRPPILYRYSRRKAQK